MLGQVCADRAEPTRGQSRTIHEQVAAPTTASASNDPGRWPSGYQALQSPSGPPDAYGVDNPDEGIRRRFGAGLGVAYSLEGVLGGRNVGAVLDDEGNLRCDEVLWAHAEILAAIGEDIAFGDAGHTLTAGLASPVQALVTFMYCVRVTNFEVSLQRDMVATVMHDYLQPAGPSDDPAFSADDYGPSRYGGGRARPASARRRGRRGPGRYPRGAPPAGGPPPL